jgi:predicted flap endonuclease-1-like 5' DNA nuclease
MMQTGRVGGVRGMESADGEQPVEQRQKPSTASAPVVVCGLGPRGVVATASYEARRFGVGSAMPTVTARRRCPQGGVFLAPRMQAYREHSAAIMAVLAGFADVLEQVSIDEAYLVVSAHPGSVTGVLAAVWQGTGLRVSVGAGRSKLVAKLASTAAKPRGQRWVTRTQEQGFLDPLPVAALPGIGPVAVARLREVGINSVAQLRALSPVRLLERLLGTAGGAAARSMAVGQDSRVVASSREVKSVSAERTLDFDVPASQRGQQVAVAGVQDLVTDRGVAALPPLSPGDRDPELVAVGGGEVGEAVPGTGPAQPAGDAPHLCHSDPQGRSGRPAPVPDTVTATYRTPSTKSASVAVPVHLYIASARDRRQRGRRHHHRRFPIRRRRGKSTCRRGRPLTS